MKKEFLSLLIMLSLIGTVFSQGPDISITLNGFDMNHYSIELAPNGSYICAGTLFDPGGTTDIHVLEVSTGGNINWEHIYNVSDDDRTLDLTVDNLGRIVLTGYTTENGIGFPELVILQLDNTGTIQGEMKYQLGSATVGTNIITNANGNYVVGGFVADFMGLPLSNNQAFLMEVDPSNLMDMNHMVYESNALTASSINDIVELPNGYFLTGSAGLLVGGQQGVLALVVGNNFNINANLSFNSSNAFHVGVSCIYDNANDEVYLLSNNSEWHNPQLSIISDISGNPMITGHRILAVDKGGTMHPAGFQLIQSPFDPNAVIAAGYFEMIDNSNFPGGTTTDASPWMAEINKDFGAINALIWPAPSPNFSLHGGNILSTFATPSGATPGQMPALFNQEIMVPDPSGNGFTFVGPRSVNGNFAVDLKNVISMDPQSCFPDQPSGMILVNHVAFNVIPNALGVQPDPISMMDQTTPAQIQDIICTSDPCPDCIVLLNPGCGVNYELTVEACFPFTNILDFTWNSPTLGIINQPGPVAPFSSLGGIHAYTLTIRFINSFGLIQTCVITDTVVVPNFNCADLITNVSYTHQCDNEYDLLIDIDPCFAASITNVNLTHQNSSCPPVISSGSGPFHSFDISGCGPGNYQLTANIIISDGTNSIVCPLTHTQYLGADCVTDININTQTINQWAPLTLGCNPSPFGYLRHTVMAPTGAGCFQYFWNNSLTPTGPVYNCCDTWNPSCSNPSLRIVDICNCCEYIIDDVTVYNFSDGDLPDAFSTTINVEEGHHSPSQTLDSNMEENAFSILNEVNIFPNPARAVAYLEFQYASLHSISVTDLNGRHLMDLESEDKTVELDIKMLNPGIYFVLVKDKMTGEMMNRKMVVH